MRAWRHERKRTGGKRWLWRLVRLIHLDVLSVDLHTQPFEIQVPTRKKKKQTMQIGMQTKIIDSGREENSARQTGTTRRIPRRKKKSSR